MLRVKLFCLLILCAGCRTTENEFQQAEKSGRRIPSGQLRSIVLPAVAQPAERYAAQQLAEYIEKMTRQVLVVVKEGEQKPQGRAIILGRTADNLKNHNPDNWPIDTIYIGYGKGDIAIIGQGDQGTLFAAYEFLRDQGCRWYMPCEVGEYVPKWASLDLAGKPKKHTPTFRDRGWGPMASLTSVIADLQYWSVRNGLNAIVPFTLNSMGPDDEVKYPPELGYGSQKMAGH